MKIRLILCLSLCLLSACSYLPDWMGGGKKEKAKIEGDRIALLSQQSDLAADATLSETPVTVPSQSANDRWPQATGNLQFSGKFEEASTIKAGDGNGWEQEVVPSVIVAGSMLFSMDAEGYISAHAFPNFEQLWLSKVAIEEDGPDMVGGGLAYADGVVYAATGYGKIFALDGASGAEKWHQEVNLPLRGAPAVEGSKVLIISMDNQLFAFDAGNGALQWNHRGISETANFLSAVTPGVSGNIVIAPYSTGLIHALQLDNGQEIWSDSLVRTRRASATAAFTGADANPIIDGNQLYAVTHGGLLAAFDLAAGQRIWEQNISSSNTPWLADDFLYVLSSENELLCIHRADGRIKWLTKLPEQQEERVRWHGPVLAGDQLLIVNNIGELLTYSTDGALIATHDVPGGISAPPSVAEGTLFLLDKNASIHILK